MQKLIVPIRGMHCKSCEILIEKNLKKVQGAKNVKVSQQTGKAEVFFSGDPPMADEITAAVHAAGYEIGEKGKLPWLSRDIKDYKNLFFAGLILLILYNVVRWLGILNFNVDTQSTSLLVVLVVGLVAGVSTCMVLVGGLVLALSARHTELHPEATAMQKFRPHLYFNLGRIAGFALLGGIVGFIGSAMRPSIGVLGLMTVLVGGVMIFLGLKLIEIFPVLRDKTISLPKRIAKLFGLHKENKEYSHRAAMTSGALTFFLPCGFTQAMQLYAVSTGSFWQGAAIMMLFALGTAPGLLGIGGLTSVFKGQKARIFFMTAGLAVILLGWVNIVNGSKLITTSASKQTPTASNSLADNSKVQEIRMIQKANGYSPNVFTVKKGVPVKWIITSETTFSCASYIAMPKYGIGTDLKKGENIFTFTPTEVGEIPFSCSMGMYRGKFIVVENESALSSPTTDQGLVASGGGCGTGGGCGGCGGIVKNN